MAVEKGQTFSGSEKVDKYRPIYYAGASGDFNPIHIDPEFGKMVGLGGAILQGLCTLAFASKTVTDWVGDPGKMKKLKCRFSAPVLMEDTISIQGTVTDVQSGRARIDLKVVNQHGVEVLQKVEAEVEA
ncbi:MAG TPA: MaoC/PaaZ C-terminal domain-containing protein [Smithellaceae bacterium]|jgi:acyl dehydratase|nr:MaoC/PaaZ C-terminal domain-containing protein [Smithellaceae bacterium]HOE22199.1 MaoC/PaaZ C-terminal domain-containing protein [Smithellaceae bacterium]HPI51030.1 MaoC/PaaZ C-terminal domain-containing protein [Smithellaceae bacterium]HPL32230.1 MaoC/PaaZ C-terminal domain-containing protein [Smithellaceae bacterium]HPO21421.1 MaoC/PaaZ C-terminal domain-containing protein [Smithellaceae bacterium]